MFSAMCEKMGYMDKNKLREMFLRKRESIPKSELYTKSEAITEIILSSSLYNDADKIFCFISVSGEPNTSRIILESLSQGKEVYVPRTKPNRIMETVRVDYMEWETADDWPVDFGIPVPPPALKNDGTAEFDLVIVPSVAVDIYGYRLGHGGGYYDTFIAKNTILQDRPVFIAIQFSDFFINKALPREAHDMRVDLIATEKGLFTSVSV